MKQVECGTRSGELLTTPDHYYIYKEVAHIIACVLAPLLDVKRITKVCLSFRLMLKVGSDLLVFGHPSHKKCLGLMNVFTRICTMFRVVFWVILPCKMIFDRRFRGAYCLHYLYDKQLKTGIL
jgi:hypothetical protein